MTFCDDLHSFWVLILLWIKTIQYQIKESELRDLMSMWDLSQSEHSRDFEPLQAHDLTIFLILGIITGVTSRRGALPLMLKPRPHNGVMTLLIYL